MCLRSSKRRRWQWKRPKFVLPSRVLRARFFSPYRDFKRGGVDSSGLVPSSPSPFLCLFVVCLSLYTPAVCEAPVCVRVSRCIWFLVPLCCLSPKRNPQAVVRRVLPCLGVTVACQNGRDETQSVHRGVSRRDTTETFLQLVRTASD